MSVWFINQSGLSVQKHADWDFTQLHKHVEPVKYMLHHNMLHPPEGTPLPQYTTVCMPDLLVLTGGTGTVLIGNQLSSAMLLTRITLPSTVLCPDC